MPPYSQVTVEIPLLKTLSGPISFHYFPNVAGRRILLLGDYHDKVSLCTKLRKGTPVEDWLKSVATHSPVCLDIFIEDGCQMIDPKHPFSLEPRSRPRSTQSTTSPLQAVRNTFGRYYQQPLRLDQARIHRIDARQFFDLGLPILNQELKHPIIKIILENIDILGPFQLPRNQQFYEDRKMMLYAYSIGIDRSDDARQLYELFLREQILGTSIPNQLAYLKQVISTITPYMTYFWSQVDQMTRNLINKGKFLRDLLSIYEKRPLLNGLIEIPVDIYLITLLFAEFTPDDLTNDPIGCRDDSQIGYAIIYAGDDHINRYIEFFKTHFDADPDPNYNIYPTMSKSGRVSQCLTFKHPFDLISELISKQSKNLIG